MALGHAVHGHGHGVQGHGVQGQVFKRLLAIGVGLIGGSICAATKERKLAGYVLGYSRSLATLHQALGLGLIDECIAGPMDANLRQVDAVVLSIPVRQYREVLLQFLPVLPSHCVLFDTGSTKADVQHVLHDLEPSFPGLLARFVPAHPIAGGELHGPQAASAQLFEGRNCVLTPNAHTQPAALALVERFWQHMGANTQTMAAADHDEMFGTVSHLPHLLAYAYVASVLQHPKGEHFMREGGAGFRDFSRIAASSPEMWADIFQNNRTALLAGLATFETTLAQLRLALENEDRNSLEALLETAAAYRSQWRPALS